MSGQATCPVLAGGKDYGPRGWASDSSADESTYYRYITNSNFLRLDSIFYCLDAATESQFKGFIATFKDTRDPNIKQAFPFGVTAQTSKDKCRGFYVRDEIDWM